VHGAEGDHAGDDVAKPEQAAQGQRRLARFLGVGEDVGEDTPQGSQAGAQGGASRLSGIRSVARRSHIVGAAKKLGDNLSQDLVLKHFDSIRFHFFESMHMQAV